MFQRPVSEFQRCKGMKNFSNKKIYFVLFLKIIVIHLQYQIKTYIMKTAEELFNEATIEADKLISKLERVFADMPSKGDTGETCQRQLIYYKIKSLEHAISGICVDDFKEWTCTDLDNEQYGRKVSEGVYEFKEKNRMQEYNDDDDFIEITIVIANYTAEQIANFISAYYDSVEQLQTIYGDESEWIIAECIFEQESGLY